MSSGHCQPSPGRPLTGQPIPERDQETVPLRPGTSLSIPAGTHFQFRAAGDGPLAAVGVTMPPWPDGGEAYEVPGPWAADVPG